MNEKRTFEDRKPYIMAWVYRIIALILFAVCIWLCFDGQKMSTSKLVNGKTVVEWAGLIKMLIGIAGMLVIIFLYNLRFIRPPKR